MLAALIAGCLNAPVLRLVEPLTGAAVTLVGTMHYNPRSVQLVRSTISEVSSAGTLGAVCVELCDERWDATVASRWRRDSTLERLFFEDEFQAAYEEARAAGVDGIELVDQPIGQSISRIAELTLNYGKATLITGKATLGCAITMFD